MPKLKTQTLNPPKGQKTEARPGVAKQLRLDESWIGQSNRLSYGNHLAFSIQDDSIQMAAVRQVGFAQTVLNLTKVYIPRSLNELDERTQFLSGEIDTYVREFGGYQPRITLTVSGPETAFRSLIMPQLKKRDLESAISFEARKQLPFPMADCHFDYRTISRLTGDDQTHLKVSLLAATNRSIQEKLAPFERLNLSVAHIYHMRDVVGQLLRKLPEFSHNLGYALINIEQNRSEISFYAGANLEFSHIISLGTSFLADRSDSTVFEYFAESLATEIQNSLDYYAGQFSNVYGSQVYVYGDLAYSDILVGFLGERFGFSFERFPTERLMIGKKRKAGINESFPVCLSAAAAALNTSTLPNLLPLPLKELILRRRFDKYAVSALTILAIVLMSAFMIQRSRLSATEEIYSDISRRVESFRNAKLFDSYTQLKRRIVADQNYISQAQKEPSYMGLNLKELALLTPISIRLYNLDYRSETEGRNMSVFGVVTTSSTPPEIVLAEYIEDLSNSPFYANVTVNRYSKKPIRDGFELDFQVSMRGSL